MKQWIDINAQVQKHVGRGLLLGDVDHNQFAKFLYSSNYYRVSGYARCFQDLGGVNKRYQEGTEATTLMKVYDLDRQVRNAVLDGVSVVETTLRSRVAYHLTQTIGSENTYLREELYLPEKEFSSITVEEQPRWEAAAKNRDKVLASFQELQSRDEIFIRHHVDKGDPVPFWALVEVVSIGTFSRFLRALRDTTILAPVVKSLQLEDERKLLQAVQNIAFLRNIAAHHGRLWNRKFDGHVTLPGVALKVKRQYLATKTPAAAFTLLAGLVDHIEGTSEYSEYLLDLVHSTPILEDGYYRPIL